jgi:hypothetical protein
VDVRAAVREKKERKETLMGHHRIKQLEDNAKSLFLLQPRLQ